MRNLKLKISLEDCVKFDHDLVSETDGVLSDVLEEATSIGQSTSWSFFFSITQLVVGQCNFFILLVLGTPTTTVQGQEF